MPSEVEDRLRTELDGQFEIVRSLGAGSSAEVYLAREPLLERLVAIKVLRPDVVSEPVAQRRFAREAQAVARISHPNVTSIHRVGALSDDLPFIVMEYVDGRTLGERVDATGPLPPSEAVQLLVGLAGALEAAHAQGIVHRDVRPANVLIEKSTKRPVLADFGIAAIVESGADASARLTATGVRLGDLRYMSPEQVQGDRPTEQSDIYSLGIVGYIALAGRFPFDAEGPAQLAAAHLHGEPIPLRTLRPEVDPAIASLIERCLAKEPRRRPRATDIVSGLSRRHATPAGSHEHHAGSLGFFSEELKRRSVFRAGGTYVAVLLGAIAVGQALMEMGMSAEAYNAVIAILLAGFPIVLALSWMYDFRDGTASRTAAREDADAAPALTRFLPLAALVASIAASGLIGWFLLVAL